MFNPTTQGFNPNPNNVVYNNQPTIPQVVTTANTQAYVPNIAYGMIETLQKRNTALTNQILNLISQAGYNNNEFQSWLQQAADYFDWLTMGYNTSPQQALPSVINDTVDFRVARMLMQHVGLQSSLSGNEAQYYQAALQKEAQIKNNVNAYLMQTGQIGQPQQQQFNAGGFAPTQYNQWNNNQVGFNAGGGGAPQVFSSPVNNTFNSNMGVGMFPNSTGFQANTGFANTTQPMGTQTQFNNAVNNVVAVPQQPATNSAANYRPKSFSSVISGNSQPTFNNPNVATEQKRSTEMTQPFAPTGAQFFSANDNTLSTHDISQPAPIKEATPFKKVVATLPTVDLAELAASNKPITETGVKDEYYAPINPNVTHEVAVKAKESVGIVTEPINGVQKFVGAKAQAAMKQEYDILDLTEQAVNEIVKATMPTRPYSFSDKNAVGEWRIPADKWEEIPVKKRGIFTAPAMYIDVCENGYYIADDDGVLVGFYSSSRTDSEIEEIIVDYEKHNDKRFFIPLTEAQAKTQPDIEATKKAFAILQHKTRIEQILKDIEDDANILKEGDTPVIVDKTIQLEEPVWVDATNTNYKDRANIAISEEMGESYFELPNCAIQYTAANFYNWYFTEHEVKVLSPLKYAKTFEEIIDVLNTADADEKFDSSKLNQINSIATRYINRKLRTMFGIPAKELNITSFMSDVLELATIDMPARGFEDEFNLLASDLTRKDLYIYDVRNDLFAEWNDLDQDAETTPTLAGLGIIRDVTILPIHSSKLALYSSVHGFTLTEETFPSLWKVIENIEPTRLVRASEILLVTQDNRTMSVSLTPTDGVYHISADDFVYA